MKVYTTSAKTFSVNQLAADDDYVQYRCSAQRDLVTISGYRKNGTDNISTELTIAELKVMAELAGYSLVSKGE